MSMLFAMSRPVSDQELRHMRDVVYAGTPKHRQSDESWETCKPHWREDEQWLTEQYRKEINAKRATP